MFWRWRGRRPLVLPDDTLAVEPARTAMPSRFPRDWRPSWVEEGAEALTAEGAVMTTGLTLPFGRRRPDESRDDSALDETAVPHRPQPGEEASADEVLFGLDRGVDLFGDFDDPFEEDDGDREEDPWDPEEDAWQWDDDT